LILGGGLGATMSNDFQRFDDETNHKIRAERLDESLDILQGLWKGESFGFTLSKAPKKRFHHLFPRLVSVPSISNNRVSSSSIEIISDILLD